MDAFEKAKTVEDLFKELDEDKFSQMAKPLGTYRRALMAEGFTRRETFRLIEAYSRFLHDMSIEEYLADKRQEEVDSLREDLEETEGEFPEDFNTDDF